MTRPPDLTDRLALAHNRARASDMFLHGLAADDLHQRLALVNRAFKSAALVTGAAEFWSRSFPDARIVSDDEVLMLEPGAHDLVIHALALHWANDPVGQLVQCRRALTPDGLFLGVTFGGQSLAELRAALTEAEVALTGGLSPRVVPMGEIRDLGGLLQRAGFALPVADSVTHRLTYRTTTHMMHDLRAMGEANALARRRRTPARRALFDRLATIYAQAYPAEDGRILATCEMIFLTGWAPADSQPKPLRPGSASHRLAEALGADTTPADKTDN